MQITEWVRYKSVLNGFCDLQSLISEQSESNQGIQRFFYQTSDLL